MNRGPLTAIAIATLSCVGYVTADDPVDEPTVSRVRQTTPFHPDLPQGMREAGNLELVEMKIVERFDDHGEPSNTHEECPNDPDKEEAGICGCGVADTDGDEDGTPDCVDDCAHDATKTAPGVCGCGIPDTDSDGDTTPDCLDGCPHDPGKLTVGDCGCGYADADADGNGTPDCLDPTTFVIEPDVEAEVTIIQDAYEYIDAWIDLPIVVALNPDATVATHDLTMTGAYGFTRHELGGESPSLENETELTEVSSESVEVEISDEAYNAISMTTTAGEQEVFETLCSTFSVAWDPVSPDRLRVGWRSHFSTAQKETLAKFLLVFNADFYCRVSIQLHIETAEEDSLVSQPFDLLFSPTVVGDDSTGTAPKYLTDARRENLMLLLRGDRALEDLARLTHVREVSTTLEPLTSTLALKPYFYGVSRHEIDNYTDEPCIHVVGADGSISVENPEHNRRFLYGIHKRSSDLDDNWLYNPQQSHSPYHWADLITRGAELIDLVPVVKSVRLTAVGSDTSVHEACEAMEIIPSPADSQAAYVDTHSSCSMYGQMSLHDECAIEVTLGNEHHLDNDFTMVLINAPPTPTFEEGVNYGAPGYAYNDIPDPPGGNPVLNGELLAHHIHYPDLLPSNEQWHAIGKAWAAVEAVAPHHWWLDRIAGIGYGANWIGDCAGGSGAFVEFKKVKISIIPPKLEFKFHPYVIWCDGGELNQRHDVALNADSSFTAIIYGRVAGALVYRMRTLSHEARHVIGKFHGKDWPFYDPCEGTGIAADAAVQMYHCTAQWCPAFKDQVQRQVVREIRYSQGISNSKRHRGLCREMASSVGMSSWDVDNLHW